MSARVLRLTFIARYRDLTMHRKVSALAQRPGVRVHYVLPRVWRDDLLAASAVLPPDAAFSAQPVALASPNDPHRVVYGTLDFGLRHHPADLIHAEEEPDSLAALQIALARRWFAPHARLVLHTWQNVDRPRGRLVRWVMARTLAAADGVCCANTEAEAILRRRGYRGATWVLPAVGVDTETFTPRPRPEARAGFVVGYLGRLVKEKGLDTLLAALALLDPGVTARLIGAGPDQPRLAALAAPLGARVQFLPPRSPAAVADALTELDALVLPSRTTPVWKEQLGRVLLEAMACGVPVIAAASGAIPEVVGDAGLLFPEGEAAALAACVRRLQTEPGLRSALSARGLARVHAHYSQTRLASALADAYQEWRSPS